MSICWSYSKNKSGVCFFWTTLYLLTYLALIEWPKAMRGRHMEWKGVGEPSPQNFFKMLPLEMLHWWVGNGKRKEGGSPPQPTRWSREHHELPSGVEGTAPVENGFQCFPSVTECLSLRCSNHRQPSVCLCLLALVRPPPSKYTSVKHAAHVKI